MKTLNYNEAYAALEKLVHELEDDSIQLDTLAEKVKKANELIAVCEGKLRNIENDVKKELKD
ncbi:MAG: exodeoxyribonuclease VII small subunit [Cyclobacteriaceae bacterium]|nr:exodeoxyribonuclease VII small subunit [Cyclobacteriaceae bacterium]